MFDSTLNVAADTNIIFISNSKIDDEGAAMFVIRSTLNIEGDLFFINNSAYSQGAINFENLILTLNIRNSARIFFIKNLARRQAGEILLENAILNAEDNAEFSAVSQKKVAIYSTKNMYLYDIVTAYSYTTYQLELHYNIVTL
jgi:hypothetical protein